jgi:hypothetical protein
LLDLHLGESACIAGDVALLGLWKSVMNLLRLRLFNKLSYMRGRCAEGIFLLCYNLVDCFCWIEGAGDETVVVAMSFCSPFEQIVKKLNFAV